MINQLANLLQVSPESIQAILPLLALNFILIIVALTDLIKHWKVRILPFFWLIIILFINLIGPILYFILGRKHHNEDT